MGCCFSILILGIKHVGCDLGIESFRQNVLVNRTFVSAADEGLMHVLLVLCVC